MAELLKFHKILHEDGNYLMEDEPEFPLVNRQDNLGVAIFRKHMDFYSLNVFPF